MRKNAKRLGLAIVVALLAFCLAACSSGNASSNSAASAAAEGDSQAVQAADTATGKHIIGVLVYDTADNEVSMFRDYLVNYIASIGFDDVQFVYSGDISTGDEVLAFIDQVADMGGEGVMSFYNLDLAAEVGRCAEHGMYHIVASGTVSEEDFAKVADNEYFLGCIGPGTFMEYTAGGNMVRNYVAHKAGDSYFILSGGAGMGNEMHYQRTLGMLDALQTGYGVYLGQTKELAKTTEPTTITVEELSVTICPGYIALDEMKQPAIDAFKKGTFNVVLSTIPVEPIADLLETSDAKIAMVDCYSQDNQILFNSGKLSYLAGKYGSLIGPSFAAMYNAVTGHAADFRDDGKAFNIVQNFWSSESEADFNDKYELASNATTPAYNFEDLYSVCKTYTPDATFEDFRDLAEASSFEDAKARRNQA